MYLDFMDLLITIDSQSKLSYLITSFGENYSNSQSNLDRCEYYRVL